MAWQTEFLFFDTWLEVVVAGKKRKNSGNKKMELKNWNLDIISFVLR